MRSFYLFLLFVGFTSISAYADDMNIGNERRVASFCNTCHGDNGFSIGKSIPTIKGQNKDFLSNSMTEFKTGKRHLTVMGKVATGYTAEEIEMVSIWFSNMLWDKSNTEMLDSKSVENGKKLATDCLSCHKSDTESYVPKINGQHTAYLYKALQEYKTKKRNNEAHATEMDIVVDMNDKDLKALADYFASMK